MGDQVRSGKAFEYALATAIHERTGECGDSVLVRNETLATAREYFEGFDQRRREEYERAARAATEHVCTVEPCLENSLGGEQLRISLQKDRSGAAGDVRDVITVRNERGWEIGFSTKNNHQAMKHSRLSPNIDFGRQWLGARCSGEYMAAISEAFGKIQSHAQSCNIRLWHDLDRKEEMAYVPVLEAFIGEMRRLAGNDPRIPGCLVEYLVGRHDFYKVIKDRRTVIIQGYNLHGTLNARSNDMRPRDRTNRLRLPTEMIRMEREGRNRAVATFDGGWQISFRIHNASSRIEPSLKFDIQLVGNPRSLYVHHVPW